MTSLRLPHPFYRRSALAALLALTSTGCEDPQREIKLQWREDEVNKKESAMIQREMAVAKEKQVLEGTRLDLLAREKNVAALQKQLAAVLEKPNGSGGKLRFASCAAPFPRSAQTA